MDWQAIGTALAIGGAAGLLVAFIGWILEWIINKGRE